MLSWNVKPSWSSRLLKERCFAKKGLNQNKSQSHNTNRACCLGGLLVLPLPISDSIHQLLSPHYGIALQHKQQEKSQHKFGSGPITTAPSCKRRTDCGDIILESRIVLQHISRAYNTGCLHRRKFLQTVKQIHTTGYSLVWFHHCKVDIS